MNNYQIFTKFHQFKKGFEKDTHIYDKLIETGITPIDDLTTGGLAKHELFLIGAPTGTGKSQLVSIIAKNVAEKGNIVLFFALEAYLYEIEDRIKYNLVLQEIYKLNNEKIKFPSFKQWKYHKLEDKIIDECEIKAIDNLNANIKNNIWFRYCGASDYTVDMFQKELFSIIQHGKPNLIIIDHLHYFEYSDEISEYKAQKRIINKLRDIGLHLEIPIILVAHLRKKDRGNKTIVPTIEEFHGSSEITKNPTMILTIAPAYEVIAKKKFIYPTYFYLSKDRSDGGKDRFIILSMFNKHIGEYETKYIAMKLKNFNMESEEIKKNDLPEWAINACNKDEFESKFSK